MGHNDKIMMYYIITFNLITLLIIFNMILTCIL